MLGVFLFIAENCMIETKENWQKSPSIRGGVRVGNPSQTISFSHYFKIHEYSKGPLFLYHNLSISNDAGQDVSLLERPEEQVHQQTGPVQVWEQMHQTRTYSITLIHLTQRKIDQSKLTVCRKISYIVCKTAFQEKPIMASLYFSIILHNNFQTAIWYKSYYKERKKYFISYFSETFLKK